MNQASLPTRGRSRFTTRTILLLAGLSLLTTGAASAGLPSPLELHREAREHVFDVLRHLERVPDHIQNVHERHLEAFFGGHEYYAPHRHNHNVYQFPVWIDDDVLYRPYTYCNDRIFGSTSHRPYLWTEWSHDDGGFWCNDCHGYYPRQHGHFQRTHRRQRSYSNDHHGRNHRRDSYRRDDHRDHRRYDRRDNHRRHEYRNHRRYDRRDNHRRHGYRDRDRHQGRRDRDRRHRRRGRHGDRRHGDGNRGHGHHGSG